MYDIVYGLLSKFYNINSKVYFLLDDYQKEELAKAIFRKRYDLSLELNKNNPAITKNFIMNNYISSIICQKYDIAHETVDYFILMVKQQSQSDTFQCKDLDQYQPLNGWTEVLYTRDICNYLSPTSKRKIKYVKLLEVYVNLAVNFDKYKIIDILHSPLYYLL